MLSALVTVGDIITYLFSRSKIVTDILKSRTIDRCLEVNNEERALKNFCLGWE
jgi:hypothetical protein